MGEKARSLIAHHVSLEMDGFETSPDTFVGPGPRFLGTSRLAAGRSWSLIFKVARGEEVRSLIAHHVSLWMDG
jgi:hypothetical protein